MCAAPHSWEEVGKRQGFVKTAFDDNCRNCGTYGHKAETCWSTDPTKPTERGHGVQANRGKQVNVLDEQSMPGDAHDQDIGGLSGDLCAVRFGMSHADDDDGCTEVVRGRRKGREHQHVENRDVRDGWPTEFENCIRVTDLELLDALEKSSKKITSLRMVPSRRSW